MLKTKLLVGLATMMMTLIVVVAPAAAEFESQNGTSHGPIKTFPEKSAFKAVEGSSGPSVECKAASGEPAGEWEIQVKTANKEGFQAPATKGPHEQLKIKKWGHCEAATFPVTVKCSLQVEQVTHTTFTGSVYPPGCELSFSNCQAKVAAGTANTNLKEVNLTNIATEEVGIVSNISGITSTSNGASACVAAGIPTSSTTGTFITTGELITKGQKFS